MNINKLYHFSKMTQVKTESMNQINDYFLLINFFILNNNNLYFFILLLFNYKKMKNNKLQKWLNLIILEKLK